MFSPCACCVFVCVQWPRTHKPVFSKFSTFCFDSSKSRLVQYCNVDDHMFIIFLPVKHILLYKWRCPASRIIYNLWIYSRKLLAFLQNLRLFSDNIWILFDFYCFFFSLFSSEIVKAIQGSKSNIRKALYRHSSSITHSPVQTGLLKQVDATGLCILAKPCCHGAGDTIIKEKTVLFFFCLESQIKTQSQETKSDQTWGYSVLFTVSSVIKTAWACRLLINYILIRFKSPVSAASFSFLITHVGRKTSPTPS